jgi:CubicO group peptidase (beta-lactamase class C family)
MLTMPPALARFADASLLQDSLDGIFQRIERKRVVVGCRVGPASGFAAIGDDVDRASAGETAFHPGCITKLLTSTLVAREVRAGTLDLDTQARVELSDIKNLEVTLAGVTIRHLLEHTHGLHDPTWRGAQMRADGYIDLGALTQSRTLHRIAPPGELYSYSHLGAWIAAAILERVRRVPYRELLNGELLRPLGIPLLPTTQTEPSDAAICPSVGTGLAVSTADALKFVAWSANGQHSWPLPGRSQAVTLLPGWSPVEKGVYRGWKCYGEGWFGHHSLRRGASALVRVQPDYDIALVVESRDHLATLVATRVFGNALPEWGASSVPRIVPSSASMDLSRYCGEFGCTDVDRVTIDLRHELTLTVGSSRAKLVPAQANVLFTQPTLPGEFAFVQLLGEAPDGFAYLWNGRRALPRRRQAQE